MPDQILQQKIFPYDGSQDSTKNPLLISPKDIVDSDNIVYTTYSTKRLRPGLRKAFPIPPPPGKRILAGIDFWRLGKQSLVYYDGSRLKTIDPLTSKFDDITGNNILPVDEPTNFLAFQGLLLAFFGGGQTPIKAWTQQGSVFDLSLSAPNAPFGRLWLNSLWIPDPSVPGRILKSKTGDPTDFLSGDAAELDLDISDGDPDGITAIFPPFFGSLYVSKRLSVFKITPVILQDGSVYFSQEKISDGVGCISHAAVVAAESNIFFPSDWGWHTFESTNKLSAIDTDLLSRDIQPIWVNDTNFNRSQYIQATYDRSLNSIVTIFPSASFNFPTDVWGFSLIAKKWYRWKNFNHTAICRYVEKKARRLRTMAFSSTGEIGILDEDIKTDYGKKFGCSLQSGIICPSGGLDDNFAFDFLGPIFVPQPGGKFTISYKIEGQFIEEMEFSMKDTTLGDELAVDFKLGQSVLGGIPEVKLVKNAAQGYGCMYQLFINYEPLDGEDESIGFELLGILTDVTPITKGIGERVA